VGVLISGRGSNMAAILDAAAADRWPCRFVLVLSNVGEAPGLELARRRGIPTALLDHRPFGRERRSEFDAELARLLAEAGADWVVLAGFMRILGPAFLGRFPGRVLNIHPSLLPSYPGLHTHERALAAREREAGCTVHLVDDSLDGGPILAQARVPVEPGDSAETLAARVLVQEHRLYPRVVRAAILGRLDTEFPHAEAARSSAAGVKVDQARFVFDST
jgi:phosphoribosylglycinamide formyltransferase-1